MQNYAGRDPARVYRLESWKQRVGDRLLSEFTDELPLSQRSDSDKWPHLVADYVAEAFDLGGSQHRSRFAP